MPKLTRLDLYLTYEEFVPNDLGASDVYGWESGNGNEDSDISHESDENLEEDSDTDGEDGDSGGSDGGGDAEDDEIDDEANRYLCKHSRNYLVLQPVRAVIGGKAASGPPTKFELTINCGSYKPSAEILDTFKESVAYGLRASLEVKVEDSPLLCLHEPFPGEAWGTC